MNMRAITDHIVNPANDTLAITVLDEPGAGGANHAYLVAGADLNRNKSLPALWGAGASPEKGTGTAILFQNGPIPENGVNGITLIVVVCKDADDAIAKGFNYAAQGDSFKPIEIEKAVVVQNGTEGGNPTVDLVLLDQTGQRFVVMLTGTLVNMLARTAQPITPVNGTLQ